LIYKNETNAMLMLALRPALFAKAPAMIAIAGLDKTSAILWVRGPVGGPVLMIQHCGWIG